MVENSSLLRLLLALSIIDAWMQMYEDAACVMTLWTKNLKLVKRINLGCFGHWCFDFSEGLSECLLMVLGY